MSTLASLALQVQPPQIAQSFAAGQQARQQLSLANLQLQAAQQQQQDRLTLRNLMPAAIQGDRQAQAQVGALQPEMLSQFRAMDEDARKQAKDRLSQLGQAAVYLRQMSPDQMQASYERMRPWIQERMPGVNLPEQIDPTLLDKFIIEGGQVTDYLTQLDRDRDYQLEVYKMGQPDYGQPFDALGPDGKPGMYRTDKRTGAIEPTGLAPMQKGGMRVVTNPDGTVSVEMGGTDLTQAERNKVQSELRSQGERLMRVGMMEQSFDPAFLRIGGRFESAWDKWREKFGDVPVLSALTGQLSPDEQKQLRGYTEFRASAGQNLSQILMEMSGAAVTAQEAERAKVWLPNAGTGIFDGDSPSEFQTKLTRFKAFTQKAQARLAYIDRRSGMTINDVSLDDMPTIMANRLGQIKQEMQAANPDAAPKQIQAQAEERLAAEFGLVRY